MLNGFMVCSLEIGRKLTVCGTVPRVGAEEGIASGNGDEESERKTLLHVRAPLLGVMKARDADLRPIRETPFYKVKENSVRLSQISIYFGRMSNGRRCFQLRRIIFRYLIWFVSYKITFITTVDIFPNYSELLPIENLSALN